MSKCNCLYILANDSFHAIHESCNCSNFAVSSTFYDHSMAKQQILSPYHRAQVVTNV